MSLLNIKSKFILYDILFQIPIKKRLEIINGSKKFYKKLEYFPITKELYDKLFNYYTVVKTIQLNQYFILH